MTKTKITLYAGLFVFIACTISSCGSKKSATRSSNNYPAYAAEEARGNRPQRVTKEKLKLDECEEMSLEMVDGKLRAYGSAVDYDRDFARQAAILRARGAMAADIKSLVENAITNYRTSMNIKQTRESRDLIEQNLESKAKEIIARSRVICSNPYALSDGTYEYTVCIEMVENIEQVAEEQAISEAEEMKLRFDQEKFKESYKEEMDAFFNSRNNQ